MNRINNTNKYMFEELVKQVKRQYQAAGIAIAIVDGDGNTVYENYFGHRDVEKELPMDQDTIFGMASVTKSFVALSVMQLCEKGMLDLDDPISKYIPEFTNKNQKTVRVRHLLNHSAGYYPLGRIQIRQLSEKLGYSEEKDGELAFITELADAGVKEVAEQLDAQTMESGLIGEPGQYMSYCNDGFGLLSEIVRRITGYGSFSEYVKENVLEPIGMERSACEYLRTRLDPNASVLYYVENGERIGTMDFINSGFALSGAGALRSTLADMKKVIYMYLNGGKTVTGKRVVSWESIRSMCKPSIEYRPDSWYCMGLSTKKLDDLTIVEHGGSQIGVSSNMSWSYEADAGVIILCNTADVPVSALADAAMRMYNGRNPMDNRSVYEDNPWSEKTVKAALGGYATNEGGVENSLVEICMEDGKVCVRADGKLQPFMMVNETTGLIRGLLKDAYIKLYKDEDGQVFAIGYGGRMLPKKK
ncbi:MAG: beta-lactamase family protein [Lachnospiraceae bacterium]|nr:beta-lactamase family protein [Lachnospiraceae bacterium]